jgi:hypothetical protein
MQIWIIIIFDKGYFEIFFIMTYVGNLDTYLGVTLVFYHNGRGG